MVLLEKFVLQRIRMTHFSKNKVILRKSYTLSEALVSQCVELSVTFMPKVEVVFAVQRTLQPPQKSHHISASSDET